jgi:hypothetical protein
MRERFAARVSAEAGDASFSQMEMQTNVWILSVDARTLPTRLPKVIDNRVLDNLSGEVQVSERFMPAGHVYGNGLISADKLAPGHRGRQLVEVFPVIHCSASQRHEHTNCSSQLEVCSIHGREIARKTNHPPAGRSGVSADACQLIGKHLLKAPGTGRHKRPRSGLQTKHAGNVHGQRRGRKRISPVLFVLSYFSNGVT